jgi:hypothetical protein
MPFAQQQQVHRWPLPAADQALLLQQAIVAIVVYLAISTIRHCYWWNTERRRKNQLLLATVDDDWQQQVGGVPSPLVWINVKDHGAAGDGATDDTASIAAAIAAAAAPPIPKLGDFASGTVVLFPAGIYIISSTLQLPNRVALRGANGRGVTIRASPKHFTGSCMFHASNGTSSMFGSRLTDMLLDATHLRPTSTAVTPAVIRADAWQETCGLSRVVLYNFVGYGLEIQHGFGGAAYLPLRDIEIFAATGGMAGIYVHQISLVVSWLSDSVKPVTSFNTAVVVAAAQCCYYVCV